MSDDHPLSPQRWSARSNPDTVLAFGFWIAASSDVAQILSPIRDSGAVSSSWNKHGSA